MPAAALSQLPAPAPAAAPAAADPWSGLLQMGMTLLQQFAGAGRPGATDGTADGTRPAAAAGPTVVRDERTGASYLKIPVPQKEVLEKVLQTVGTLIKSLQM